MKWAANGSISKALLQASYDRILALKAGFWAFLRYHRRRPKSSHVLDPPPEGDSMRRIRLTVLTFVAAYGRHRLLEQQQ